MNAASPASTFNSSQFTDFKVADISLADFGRKEISLAEAEMPALMGLRRRYSAQNRLLVPRFWVVFT